jgi:hypothetical protein
MSACYSSARKRNRSRVQNFLSLDPKLENLTQAGTVNTRLHHF